MGRLDATAWIEKKRVQLLYFADHTPTAILLAKFFFLIFALGALLEPLIPAFGREAFFVDVNQPFRSILGFLIIILLYASVFHIDKKYCLVIIYFLCAVRISDSLFGGVALIAFLWFGAALICTYAVYRVEIIDKIKQKEHEKKIYGEMNQWKT